MGAGNIYAPRYWLVDPWADLRRFEALLHEVVADGVSVWGGRSLEGAY